MRIKKPDISNCFDGLPDDAKKIVIGIAANFHYRTMEKHDDGSMGVIKITPGELNDALAYAMRCFEGERL